jgi:hypothetical protein
MQTTLAALAVIAVGYILAYLVFDRLRDRYGYVGGAEYVVIGFLLGPRVTGLLGAGQVQDLTPIVSLALGWLGMLLGTYFRLPTLALVSGAHLRIAFAEALATFGCATGALVVLFRFIVGYPWPDALVQSITLGAVATLSSPAAVDVVTRRPGGSPLFPVLRLTARIDALVAVNYTQVRPDLNADLILTATLVSVLLFEIVASREAGALAAAVPADQQHEGEALKPELLRQ